MGTRNERVTRLICGFHDDLVGVAKSLREVIHDTIDGMSEDVRWGVPVFSVARREVLYMAESEGYITLGIYTQNAIDDPAELLEGDSRSVRHVRVTPETDLTHITALIRQAVC